MGVLAIFLLAGSVLYFWQPDRLADLQLSISEMLSGVSGSETPDAAPRLPVDYRDDPNQSSTPAGEHISLDEPLEFRQLERLSRPQAWEGQLNKLDDNDRQYLFGNQLTGGQTGIVAYLGPAGHEDLRFRIPAMQNRGRWLAWDFDYSGGDELLPICPVLELDPRELAVAHYLWEGLDTANATVVLNQLGEPMKVLHGRQPDRRADFVPVFDVNGDGHKELILTDEMVGAGQTKFLVYGQLGKKLASLLVKRRTYFAGVSDTNGDGHRELILFDEDTHEILAMSLRGEQRIVQTPQPFENITGMPDLDGDGIHELVDMGRAWWNPATGSFVRLDPPLGAVPPGESSAQHFVVLAADLDLDGARELVVLHGEGESLSSLGIYGIDGRARQYRQFDKPMADAAVLTREGRDYLILISHSGSWCYP